MNKIFLTFLNIMIVVSCLVQYNTISSNECAIKGHAYLGENMLILNEKFYCWRSNECNSECLSNKLQES